jgi:hypothetical protein
MEWQEMINALAAFGLATLALIWWRYAALANKVGQHDKNLHSVLSPIAKKLAEYKPVQMHDIRALARQPQYRFMLYRMLKYYQRLDLFPVEYLTIIAQGEGILAFWMMDPNQLQDAPSEIHLVEEVERVHKGWRLKYLVYRYRMHAGHWTEKDGWLLGIVGPFFENDVPYSGVAEGF